MTDDGRPALSSEVRIGEILRLWEEARERGHDLSPAELCRDCPELEPAVAKQIEDLRVWDRFDAPSLPVGSGGEPAYPPAPPPQAALIALELADLQLLAQGGLGAVYRAIDGGLGREVAVKVPVNPDGTDVDHEAEQRFLREVRVTAQLQHPGIVPVYGLGQDSRGRPCYAMRFIGDQTLRDAIREYHEARRAGRDGASHRSPRRDEAFRALLRRFKAACLTVAYAHSRGLLHRDLKPEHILLGDFDETFVVDWGLTGTWRGRPGPAPGRDGPAAEIRTGDDLRTQAGIGTLGFASPEQQAGDWDRVGPASDVFSLGATLYVLLTDHRPFPGASHAEVLAKVERGEVVAPRDRDADVPRPLEAVCLKALAPRPEDRYAAATELADEIERWLANEPVRAWREPWTARLGRWVDRQRPPVSGALACAATLLVVLGLAGYVIHRARVTELIHRAEAQRQSDLCRRDALGHAEQRRQEAERHAEQVAALNYVDADQAAGEVIRQRRQGWATRAIEEVGRAAAIATPMRSVETLRGRVAEVCGGFDLKEREGGRLTTINSASLAFSPDSKRLAIGEHHRQELQPCRVQVFDVARKLKVAEYAISGGTLDTGRTGVSALAFSPDGRWLAAGLRDGRIMAWDTRHEPPSPMALLGHKDRIRGLAFTPDGATLVSGSRDGSVRIWAAGSAWTEVLALDVPDVVSSVALSPDGRRVAVGCDDSGRVYELSRLGSIPISTRPALVFNTPYTNLVFSPDGRIVVASDVDRNLAVGLGRAKGQRLLFDPDFGAAHTMDINQVSFHPTGTLLVSGSMDNTLKVWDLAADQVAFRMAAFTESAVVPVFSPDGRTLAVATSEGTALYDVLGPDVMTTRGLDVDPVQAFAFVAGGTPGPPALATASRGRREMPCAARKLVRSWRSRVIAPGGGVDLGDGPEAAPDVPAFDAHPTRPMVAHNAGFRVGLYDAGRGRLMATIPEAQSTALRFSPDGARLWGVIDDHRVVSWSVPDLAPQTTWELDRTDRPRGRIGIACLAAGSTRVVVGTRSGRVCVLGASQGQREHSIQAGGPVQSIALSPDEAMVACGLIDGPLALYRLSSSEKVAEVPGHRDTIDSVAFDPGGRILASASRDKGVVLWDLRGPQPEALIRLPSPSDRPVLAARFSPDGRVLGMLVWNERAVRLWDLDRLRSRLAALGLDWSEGDSTSESAQGRSGSHTTGSNPGPPG